MANACNPPPSIITISFSAFRFQQLYLPIVNILNEPPQLRVSETIVFCLALQQIPWLPKPFKCNVDDNAVWHLCEASLMSHGRAWLRLRWRMSISPVENKAHVSQPSCHLSATRANIGSLHSPHADTRQPNKSGLAPLLSIQASVLWAIQLRKSVHKAEFQSLSLTLAQFSRLRHPPILAAILLVIRPQPNMHSAQCHRYARPFLAVFEPAE